MPMLDDCICRVDKSTIHIKEYTGEGVLLWSTTKTWMLVEPGHDDKAYNTVLFLQSVQARSDLEGVDG